MDKIIGGATALFLAVVAAYIDSELNSGFAETVARVDAFTMMMKYLPAGIIGLMIVVATVPWRSVKWGLRLVGYSMVAVTIAVSVVRTLNSMDAVKTSELAGTQKIERNQQPVLDEYNAARAAHEAAVVREAEECSSGEGKKCRGVRGSLKLAKARWHEAKDAVYTAPVNPPTTATSLWLAANGMAWAMDGLGATTIVVALLFIVSLITAVLADIGFSMIASGSRDLMAAYNKRSKKRHRKKEPSRDKKGFKRAVLIAEKNSRRNNVRYELATVCNAFGYSLSAGEKILAEYRRENPVKLRAVARK